MILKAILVPIGLILLFGGGFVALSKPFNLKATLVVLGIGVSIVVVGIASGWPKWLGVVALGMFALGLFLRRFKV